MTVNETIADQAVGALATVRAMTTRCDNDHPERHALREVRRAAEETLLNAFRQVRTLALVAETICDFADEVKERAQ